MAAAGGGDGEVIVTLPKGAVGSQAIAFKVAAEGILGIFGNEDVIQAGVGLAGVAVAKNAVVGMMVGPEVALRGFAIPGLEVANGSLIGFEVVAQTKSVGVMLVEGPETFGQVIVS
jgi:hypothetical protein